MQQRGISYDWIRKCRQDRGLSQQEVANRAGISRTYLSNLERGVSDNPTLGVVKRLSDALDAKYAPVESATELDSGYQIMCSVTGLKFRELVDWLAEQVGCEFPNGDVIVAIENFQVFREGPYHDCIAICRVARGDNGNLHQ